MRKEGGKELVGGGNRQESYAVAWEKKETCVWKRHEI